MQKYSDLTETICFFFFFFFLSFLRSILLLSSQWILQNEYNVGLDLSEARASLLSGDVVELTNATSTDSTSMKLVWEVSSAENKSHQSTIWRLFHHIFSRSFRLFVCQTKTIFSVRFFLVLFRFKFAAFKFFVNMKRANNAMHQRRFAVDRSTFL